MEVRTKVCYEELLDKFKSSAEQWLKETPEARGLTLVVDWAVGESDFPPSLTVSKGNSERSVLATMKQMVKGIDRLSDIYLDMIRKQESMLAKAEELVKNSVEVKSS